MKIKFPHNENGLNHVLVIALSVVVLALGATGYRVYSSQQRTDTPAEAADQAETADEAPEEAVPAEVIETPPAQSTTPKPKTPALAEFTTPITIKGDDKCRSDTLAALKLVSDKAPAHYATVIKYVGVIECIDKGSGMYAYEAPPRYVVGDVTRNASTMWYAGTIVHDAGHSKLYHDYLDAHPGESVPYEEWGGEESERLCLEVQHDALTKMGADQYILDHVRNSINTQYWNIPYEDRWW